jgi:hypothetical protein
MTITVAVVIKNVCVSRRQKDEHVAYRTCLQTPVSFAPLLVRKPDQAPVYPICPESDQHRNLTLKTHSDETVCRTRPYE